MLQGRNTVFSVRVAYLQHKRPDAPLLGDHLLDVGRCSLDDNGGLASDDGAAHGLVRGVPRAHAKGRRPRYGTPACPLIAFREYKLGAMLLCCPSF